MTGERTQSEKTTMNSQTQAEREKKTLSKWSEQTSTDLGARENLVPGASARTKSALLSLVQSAEQRGDQEAADILYNQYWDAVDRERTRAKEAERQTHRQLAKEAAEKRWNTEGIQTHRYTVRRMAPSVWGFWVFTPDADGVCPQESQVEKVRKMPAVSPGRDGRYPVILTVSGTADYCAGWLEKKRAIEWVATHSEYAKQNGISPLHLEWEVVDDLPEVVAGIQNSDVLSDLAILDEWILAGPSRREQLSVDVRDIYRKRNHSLGVESPLEVRCAIAWKSIQEGV